jgi:hypothetical protein
MPFTNGLKLLHGLCGDDIVVAMKIERAVSSPVTAKKANGSVATLFVRDCWRRPLTFKASFTHSAFEEIRTCAIILPRWILRRYGHQLR